MDKQKECNGILKGRKPGPYRIVSLSSLNMTKNTELDYVENYIVDYSGKHNSTESWKPISNKYNNVSVSLNSWTGLRERLNYQEKYISGVA